MTSPVTTPTPQTSTPAPWLSDSAYNNLKSFAQIWLPALGTLYFALAQIWHLPAAEGVTGSVVAFDTFLGVLLGYSTVSYNASGAKYDGQLSYEPNGEDGTALHLNGILPSALETKDEIVLKINRS